MRLDKWLWAARFFKSRSLAVDAIDRGRVRLGGERLKPAREVRIGDALQIQMSETRLDVVVRALAQARGPAARARLMYEETPESRVRRQRLAEVRRVAAEPARSIEGRPTKRDGRQLRRLQAESD